MFAAAGWAFLYLLCGGGLGGAVLIFIVLKMIGRLGDFGYPSGFPPGAGRCKSVGAGKWGRSHRNGLPISQ